MTIGSWHRFRPWNGHLGAEIAALRANYIRNIHSFAIESYGYRGPTPCLAEMTPLSSNRALSRPVYRCFSVGYRGPTPLFSLIAPPSKVAAIVCKNPITIPHRQCNRKGPSACRSLASSHRSSLPDKTMPLNILFRPRRSWLPPVFSELFTTLSPTVRLGPAG